MEDVTNILKTYVIGEQADDHLPQLLPAAADTTATAPVPVQTHLEENVAPIIEAIEEPLKIERIYVDSLAVEDEERELARAEYHLRAQGAQLEGESTLRRMHRLESESSIESLRLARCAHVFADCNFTRTEDFSSFTVTVAQPRELEVIIALQRRRVARDKSQMAKARLEMETAGKTYIGETSLQQSRRLETSESLEEERTLREATRQLSTAVQDNATTLEQGSKLQEKSAKEVLVDGTVEMAQAVERSGQKQIEVREADGTAYELTTAGVELCGELYIGGTRRARPESESSEEAVREREAISAAYEIHQSGIDLRGAARFGAKRGHYESASSLESSLYGGGPTAVDLIREESKSHFDAIIEIGTWAEPLLLRARERRAVRVPAAVVKLRTEQKINLAAAREGKSVIDYERTDESQSKKYQAASEQTQSYGVQKAQSYQHHETYSFQQSEQFQVPLQYQRSQESHMAQQFQQSYLSQKEQESHQTQHFQQLQQSQQQAQEMRHTTSAEEATLLAGIDAERLLAGSHERTLQGFGKATESTISTVPEFADEHATSIVFLENLEQPDEVTDGTLRTGRRLATNLSAKSFQKEETSLSCMLAQDTSTESQTDTNISTPNLQASSFSGTSMRSESAVTSTSLNRSSEMYAVTGRARERVSTSAASHFTEYGEAAENCAVLMKRTGGLYEKAGAILAEAVIGESTVFSLCVPGFFLEMGLTGTTENSVKKAAYENYCRILEVKPILRKKESSVAFVEALAVENSLKILYSEETLHALNLNTANITSRMHLTNYACLLPAHRAASLLLPLVSQNRIGLVVPMRVSHSPLHYPESLSVTNFSELEVTNESFAIRNQHGSKEMETEYVSHQTEIYSVYQDVYPTYLSSPLQVFRKVYWNKISQMEHNTLELL